MSAADDLDEVAPKAKAAAKPAAKAAKAPARAVKAPAAPAKAATKSAKPAAKPAAVGGKPAKAVARPAAKSDVSPAKGGTKVAAKSGAKSAKAGPKASAKPGAASGKSARSAKAGAAPRAIAKALPNPVVEAAVVVEARAGAAVAIEVVEATVVEAGPPADTWDAAARDSLRWTSTVMAIVPVFLLLFNAASLKNWADQLAPSPTTVAIQKAADGWEATTRTLGLSAPRDALHNAWNKAVALKWNGTSGDGAEPQ